MYRNIEAVVMHIAVVFVLTFAIFIMLGIVGVKAHGTGTVCHSHDGKTVHCHRKNGK